MEGLLTNPNGEEIRKNPKWPDNFGQGPGQETQSKMATKKAKVVMIMVRNSVHVFFLPHRHQIVSQLALSGTV
jgi:hypothetical protein